MTQSLDRLGAAFDTCVEAALPSVDYDALYTCQVISQNADGTLDLQPNSSRVPGQKNIPIRLGFPGTLSVQAGTSMLLGWENGDPSVPFACLPVAGSPGSAPAAARVGDLVTITQADIAALTLTLDPSSGIVTAATPIPPGTETSSISTGSQQTGIA